MADGEGATPAASIRPAEVALLELLDRPEADAKVEEVTEAKTAKSSKKTKKVAAGE